MIQALNDVRARMAEVGAQLPAGHHHDHRAADPVGLPDHLVRRHRRPRPVGAPRLRLLRPAAPDQPHPRRLVRHGPGGRHPRDPRRGRAPGPGGGQPLDRRRGRPAGQGAPAQGRRAGSTAGRCNTRCSPTRWRPTRSTWRTVVIAEKNGQSIRLRDLGRVTIGHEDRTMAIRSNGKDAVALTVFRRLGGNALAVSQRPGGRAGRRRQERPAGHRDPSRLRPGPAGPHGDRQRPRRHRHRRPDERRRPPAVPQEPPGHADRRAVDPAEPDHQLRLPLPDRRHAQPDVAGRAGGGDRADHRRHRGRDREHRAAPGRGADRRRGRRPRQPRDQRRGHRLDADDDPGLRAAGVRQRGGRPVLPVAEPVADAWRWWSRWSSA